MLQDCDMMEDGTDRLPCCTWEDFGYTYLRSENRFACFGNGGTQREKEFNYDIIPYLRKKEDNDLRDLHERWWDM